jgi:hypothetical protein
MEPPNPCGDSRRRLPREGEAKRPRYRRRPIAGTQIY